MTWPKPQVRQKKGVQPVPIRLLAALVAMAVARL
jgi:hypothetical protein